MARPARRSLAAAAALALALAPLFSAGAARADYTVQQKVSFAAEGKGAADFSWAVNDREFRLDVKRGADQRSFVFNGRVFYVCGRLDKTRLDAIRKMQISDKALLASLEKGVCQDLGTEFGVRFFLSPYDAVGSADAAAGFSTSLGVDSSEIELTGTTANAGGVKCVNFTRTYVVADKKAGGSEELDETACNAPSVKWRAAFGRQLGMTLIRQPNGKQTFQILSGDLKKMPGLTLTTTAKVSGKAPGGKAVNRSFTVATSAVKEGELKPADLGFPAGYDSLDPEAVAAAGKSYAPKKGDGGDLSFDALLRAMILSVNPLAAIKP